MKKFTQINETLLTSLENKLDSDVFLDIKKAVIEMLEKTTNSDDIKVAKTFVNSYLENDETNYLIGFVNDADIYDFYIKYIDVIDQLLLKEEHFEKKPSELGVQSVYRYIIVSTKLAVVKLLTELEKIM